MQRSAKSKTYILESSSEVSDGLLVALLTLGCLQTHASILTCNSTFYVDKSKFIKRRNAIMQEFIHANGNLEIHYQFN